MLNRMGCFPARVRKGMHGARGWWRYRGSAIAARATACRQAVAKPIQQQRLIVNACAWKTETREPKMVPNFGTKKVPNFCTD